MNRRIEDITKDLSKLTTNDKDDEIPKAITVEDIYSDGSNDSDYTPKEDYKVKRKQSRVKQNEDVCQRKQRTKAIAGSIKRAKNDLQELMPELLKEPEEKHETMIKDFIINNSINKAQVKEMFTAAQSVGTSLSPMSSEEYNNMLAYYNKENVESSSHNIIEICALLVDNILITYTMKLI